MKTILKKAVLKNTGYWTTIITWYSLIDGSTQIEKKQNYEKKSFKKHNHTHLYEFSKTEFEKSYNKFHELVRSWR